MILGIDIGGTTTDAVALKDGEIRALVSVQASDPITAAAGALGKIVDVLNAPLSDIRVIAATGVGSGKLGSHLLGIPVVVVDEFTSIGTAGSLLADVSRAIVVSMGTGTALVTVDGTNIAHWGGIGVGGGTLLGLSRLVLNVSTIPVLTRKARGGHLETVDLTVGDIAGGPLNNLPASATASNFGKVSDDATDEDKALAIINLVCQTIGVVAVAAARGMGFSDIVLTGKLTTLPQTREIVSGVGKLFGMTFHVPEQAPYATAIGAAQHVYHAEGFHD